MFRMNNCRNKAQTKIFLFLYLCTIRRIFILIWYMEFLYVNKATNEIYLNFNAFNLLKKEFNFIYFTF